MARDETRFKVTPPRGGPRNEAAAGGGDTSRETIMDQDQLHQKLNELTDDEAERCLQVIIKGKRARADIFDHFNQLTGNLPMAPAKPEKLEAVA